MEAERLRFSHLKYMARSPLHYQHGIAHGYGTSSAMQKGTGVHGIISGTRKVIAYPGKTRNGKEYDAFAAAHEGYEILTTTDYNATMGMVEAVLKHKEASELLMKGTQVEQTILFDYCGRPARTTPDAFTSGYACELKTTSTTEPDLLMRHYQRMHYHAQMAFHLEGMHAAGMSANEAFIVGVEAKAPHAVTILRLTPNTLAMGDRLIRLWLERLIACEESGVWPPYVSTILDWDIEEDVELTFAEDEAA